MVAAVAVDEKWEKSLLLLYLKSFAKSQESEWKEENDGETSFTAKRQGIKLLNLLSFIDFHKKIFTIFTFLFFLHIYPLYSYYSRLMMFKGKSCFKQRYTMWWWK